MSSDPGPAGQTDTPNQATPDGERRQRRQGTQALMLAWCLWLIGSWAVTLGVTSARLASRLLMPFAALMGLALIWPVLRLSQGGARARKRPFATGSRPPDGLASAGRILQEWLGLNIVLQAVMWPLMLNAQWTARQTIWIDALLAAWSLLTALLIALGARPGRWPTPLSAMAACLLLTLGEPALMGLVNLVRGPGHGFTWQMRLSPIDALWALIQPQADRRVVSATAAQIVAVGAAAMLGWTGLLLAELRRQR